MPIPDPATLTPLTPEVISKQATINIGTIGHVAHGKSTVVKAISGVNTVRTKPELERNITIKLGYANAKIYKADPAEDGVPGNYRAKGSTTPDIFEEDGRIWKLQRHVSFVDCFGPEVMFATPTGTIANMDIVQGTVLLGPDGKARTVGAIEDGVKPMYRVDFVSKSSIGALEQKSFTCTGGHLLCLRIDTRYDVVVRDSAKGKYFVKQYLVASNRITSSKAWFDRKTDADEYYASLDKSPIMFTMTVEAYMASPATIRTKATMYRAETMNTDSLGRAVDLARGTATSAEVGWLVGLWLGDGDAMQPRFALSASGDLEIKARMADIGAKLGLMVVAKEDASCDTVWVDLLTASGSASNQTEASNFLAENIFYQILVLLDLVGDKHISSLLFAQPVEVRAAVAAGMFDADGSYRGGQYDLEQSEATHARLFLGYVRLLRTLGFLAHPFRQTVVVNGDPHRKLRVRFNGPVALPIATKAKRGAVLTRGSATSQPFTIVSIGDGQYRKWAVSRPSSSVVDVANSSSVGHEAGKAYDVDDPEAGMVLLESFVVGHNCPGHDILMATMLNGAAVMDAAVLLIAGNESCPQPQTSEHLAAVEIMRLTNIVILQNKVDLIKPQDASMQHEQIRKFVAGTVADSSPIIPISAVKKLNIDVVCEYLTNRIPVPPRDFTSSPRLIVIRSFDVNKPGETVEDLKGGVAGGSILQGVLRVGDMIEVRPGIVTKDAEGNVRCVPIFSKIVSLFAEQNELEFAVPGGLIGVGTRIDPTLTRADRLVGQVLGLRGQLPQVFTEVEISYYLLRRLLGVKTQEGGKQAKVQKLTAKEILMVNIGSTATGGKVLALREDSSRREDYAKILLTQPVCTQEGEKIALSRRVDKHWRLIGWGQIRKGTTIDISDSLAKGS